MSSARTTTQNDNGHRTHRTREENPEGPEETPRTLRQKKPSKAIQETVGRDHRNQDHQAHNQAGTLAKTGTLVSFLTLNAYQRLFSQHEDARRLLTKYNYESTIRLSDTKAPVPETMAEEPPRE